MSDHRLHPRRAFPRNHEGEESLARGIYTDPVFADRAPVCDRQRNEGERNESMAGKRDSAPLEIAVRECEAAGKKCCT